MFFLRSIGLDDFVLSVFKAVMLVFGVSFFVVVHKTAFLPLGSVLLFSIINSVRGFNTAEYK